MFNTKKALTLTEIIITMIIFGATTIMLMNLTLKRHEDTSVYGVYDKSGKKVKDVRYSGTSAKKEQAYADRIKGVNKVIVISSSDIKDYSSANTYQLQVLRALDYKCKQGSSGLPYVKLESKESDDNTKIVYQITIKDALQPGIPSILTEVPKAESESEKILKLEAVLKPYMASYPELGKKGSSTYDCIEKLLKGETVEYKGAYSCEKDETPEIDKITDPDNPIQKKPEINKSTNEPELPFLYVENVSFDGKQPIRVVIFNRNLSSSDKVNLNK